MKLFLPALFILFSLSKPDISEIRKLYPNVASSETNAKEFAAILNYISIQDDKVLVAYKGASITVLSKFIKKVPEKIKNFKEGIKLVEYAVENEPNSVEIRLIRLSIQENVPKIVNYNKNKTEDALFILTHYKEQSKSVSTHIKNFILQSKSFSDKEKQTIK